MACSEWPGTSNVTYAVGVRSAWLAEDTYVEKGWSGAYRSPARANKAHIKQLEAEKKRIWDRLNVTRSRAPPISDQEETLPFCLKLQHLRTIRTEFRVEKVKTRSQQASLPSNSPSTISEAVEESPATLYMIGTGSITCLTTAPFSSHQTDNTMKEGLDWLNFAITAKEFGFHV